MGRRISLKDQVSKLPVPTKTWYNSISNVFLVIVL